MADTGTPSTRDHAELIRVRLRIVAIAALLTGIAATVVFTVLVHFLGGASGTNYAEIIHAHSVTHSQLPSLVMIGGLVLLVIVCITVWLVALYGSFRIAGPLYRFEKNLQNSLNGASQLGIRRNDALQDLSGSLLAGISSLNQHYQSLDELAQEAIRCAEDTDINSQARLEVAIGELKAATNRIQLND